MHVVSKSKLATFWAANPDSEAPLSGWLRLARRHDFLNFAELKTIFGSVDQVGRLSVFDIGGNKYRLIAAIHFNRQKIFVRAILRHSDYDKGKWRVDL
jgi:mRNA interferase HigB